MKNKLYKGKLPKRGTLVCFSGAEVVGNKSGKYVVVDTCRWKKGSKKSYPCGGASIRVVELGDYPITEMNVHVVDVSIVFWNTHCEVIKR